MAAKETIAQRMKKENYRHRQAAANLLRAKH
jgi:hypothetical protein